MLIIVDRDGVINEDSDAFIKNPDEWIPIAGSLDAIARLNRAGYRVAVATNQSGIGRGLFDEQALAAIHERFYRELDQAGGCVDLLVYCPHHPDDGCDCRKPKPGLVKQIERELGESAQGGWVVGDSLRDLEAGIARGARPILVLTGKGERARTQGNLPEQTLVAANLAAAADLILASGST